MNNDSSELAKQQLRKACRAKDRSVRLAWAITICEAILLALAAIALIDYWLMVPVGIRTGGATVLAALALFGIYRLIRFYRRPSRMKDAALDVEAQRPEIGCEVSTAAEYLAGERQPKQEYEPQLAAALETRAAEKLRAAPVPYHRKLLKPAFIMAITLGALLLAGLLVPGMLTAFARAVFPFGKAQYTTVEVKPGNAEIRSGSDIAITNLFRGREPKDAQLHWCESTNAVWAAVPLTKDSNGSYVHSFKNVRGDFKYRVTGADAASDEFEVTTFVPPEVKDLAVRLHYPEYTKLKLAEQETPDISALRASIASLRIEPTAPLSKARLRFSNLPEVALQPGSDGTWAGAFKVTTNSEYWIELVDAKGRVGVNEKPYRIKAVPDAPPRVEILEPGKDIRAASTNVVPLRISAADDFGVAEVKVVFHKLGGTNQSLAAKPVREHNGELIATADLNLAPLNLREYDLLAYHAEATDHNNIDGPGVGKSRVYFIEITDKQDRSPSNAPPRQGESTNLIAVQKQIIADTAALADNAAPEKFKALSQRQRDATELGRTYVAGLGAGAAPAASEIQAAMRDMESASGRLEALARGQALPPEESALAHLYQALKLMPEMTNALAQRQATNEMQQATNRAAIVLEPIKGKKNATNDVQRADAIEQALWEASELAREQADVNSALKDLAASAGDEPSAADGKNSENSPESQAAPKLGGENKDGAKAQAQGKGKGEGKGKGQGKGEGQGEGEGQGKGDAEKPGAKPGELAKNKEAKHPGELANPQAPPPKSDATEQDNQEPKDPAELAAIEEQLGKEVQALADKLQRLARRDPRVGQNIGQNANDAGVNMARAAEALKEGRPGAAGINGAQSAASLQRVIAQLARVLKDQPVGTDVANEQFPKEYETVIAEYLKKLSYAE